MIFDIEETSGISDIGISLAIVFLDSFLVSMIDFDSFFDGVKGIDEVVDVSTVSYTHLTLPTILLV